MSLPVWQDSGTQLIALCTLCPLIYFAIILSHYRQVISMQLKKKKRLAGGPHSHTSKKLHSFSSSSKLKSLRKWLKLTQTGSLYLREWSTIIEPKGLRLVAPTANAHTHVLAHLFQRQSPATWQPCQIPMEWQRNEYLQRQHWKTSTWNDKLVDSDFKPLPTVSPESNLLPSSLE